MTLFLSLLPLFLFGNLHCAGMCGPLVMLLAKHRFRWFYFLGRSVAFTLAGLISAEMGMMLFYFLSRTHLSAIFSLLFGIGITLAGISLLFQIRFPGSGWLAKKSSKLSFSLAKLMGNDSMTATFLFGFCTILLPCGQTIVVFSIIALDATPLAGMINGCLFALLTSPALIAAMHASLLFQKQRGTYHLWMGGATILVGCLALLRGFAELNWVPHLILNPSSEHHLVLY